MIVFNYTFIDLSSDCFLFGVNFSESLNQPETFLLMWRTFCWQIKDSDRPWASRKSFNCKISAWVGFVSGFPTEQREAKYKVLNPILELRWQGKFWTIQLWLFQQQQQHRQQCMKSYFPRMKFYGLCQLNSTAFEFNTIFHKELTGNCSQAKSFGKVLLTQQPHQQANKQTQIGSDFCHRFSIIFYCHP